MPAESSKKPNAKSSESDSNSKPASSILDSLKKSLGLSKNVSEKNQKVTSNPPKSTTSSSVTTSNAILGTFSKWYYSAEDRYYDLLDQLSEKLPVYSIVDPIDKVFPSFILFSLLLLLLLISLTLFIFSALFSAPSTIGLIRVIDNSQNPIEGATIQLSGLGLLNSPQTLDSNADGFISFNLATGDELNVAVEASANGFDSKKTTLSFFPPDELMRTITLNAPITVNRKYVLQIKDQTSNKPIFDSSLSFNQGKTGSIRLFCLSNATNRGSQSFTQSSVELDSTKIAGCSKLQVTISLDGYDDLPGRNVEGDLTIISLKRTAAPKASLTVRVKDANTKQPVSGISLKVRSSSGTELTSLTDESGTAVLNVLPATQQVFAYDPNGVYADTSKSVDLSDGKDTEIELFVTKLPPELQKKIALKIVDANTNNGLAANVRLYKNTLLLDESSANSSGIYSFAIGDENNQSTYSVVISEPSHITLVLASVNPVPKNEPNPLLVKLQPIIRDVNDNPLNGFQANVWVKADNNSLLSGIDSFVYDSRYFFPILSGKTGSNGLFTAYNLPTSASYYATAQNADSNGRSITIAATDGQKADLNISLITGQATIKITVQDLNGSLIPNALVTFTSRNDYNSFSLSTTANGQVSKSFKVSQWIDVIVSKEGYDSVELPPISLFNARDATINVTALLFKSTTINEKLDLRLVGILNSNWQQGTSPNTLVKGGEYYLRYRLRSTENASNATTYVTADQPDLNIDKSTISILNVISSASSVTYYQDVNNQNPYDENLVIIESPAKHVILRFNELTARVQKEFLVKIKVSDATTVPDDANFEVQFGSKTQTPDQNIGPLRRSFQLREPLCILFGSNCPAFLFVETIRNQETNQALSLNNGKYALTPELTYQLFLSIHNLSGQSFNSVELALDTNNDHALKIDQNRISFSSFSPGLEVSVDSILRSLFSTENASILAQLNQNTRDRNHLIPIRIIPKNKMRVQLLSSIIPNAPNPQYLYLNAQDLSNASFLEGVQFTASLNPDLSDASVAHSTPENKSSVQLAINLPQDLSSPTIYIRAQKPGFEPFDLNFVPGSFDPIQSGDQNWNCVKIVDPNNNTIEITEIQNVPLGGNRNFKIISTCDQELAVTIYTRVAPSPPGICAPRLTNLSDNDSTACPSDPELSPFILTKNGPGKEIKIERFNENQLPGTYGIYIDVQPQGDNTSTRSLAKRLIVNLLPTTNQSCLSINQTFFDFTNESVSRGQFTNNCPYIIPNPLFPNLRLDRSIAFLSFNRPYNNLLSFQWTPSLKATCTETADLSSLTSLELSCLTSSGCLGLPKSTQIDLSTVQINRFAVGQIDLELFQHKTTFASIKDATGNPQCEIEYAFNVSNSQVELTPVLFSDRDEVVGSFIPTPSINGTYDFNLFDQGVQGDQYATLTAEDYTDENPLIEEFVQWPLNFKITAGDTNILYDSNNSRTIPADGNPHLLFRLSDQGIESNTGTYTLETTDVNLDVYFKNPDGSVSKTTTQRDANVFAGVIGTRTTITNSAIDVVFLVDTSGSLDVTWKTVCEKFDRTIERLNDLNMSVSKMVYGMGDKRGCSAQKAPWGDSDQRPYNGSSTNEAWAATGQYVIENYNWRPNAYKALIVVSDNAPGGRDNGEWEGNAIWKVPENINLVENIKSKAIATGIHLFFSHTAQLEGQNATVKDRYTNGDNQKLDSIEAFEIAANATGGTVAVYNEDAVTIDGETTDSISYAILLATYPTQQQSFHILMQGGREACYGPDNKSGFNGIGSTPKLAWTWNWNNIDVNTCAARLLNGEINNNAVYCDSSQFYIFTLKRLKAYEAAVLDGNLDLAEKLANFEGLLQRDGFSDDFRADFDADLKLQTLGNGINWYTGPVRPFSDIFLNNNRFKFSVQPEYSNLDEYPEPVSQYTLNNPGHYLVRLVIQRSNLNVPTFFEGTNPNVNITIRLNYLHLPVDNNPFYYLPLNGKVGFVNETSSFERIGYGSSFSGDNQVAIMNSPSTAELLMTYRGNALFSGIQSSHDGTLASTIASKGIILSAQLDQDRVRNVNFEPSRPTPVLASTKVRQGVSGFAYLLRKDNIIAPIDQSVSSLLHWTQVGSDVKIGSVTESQCLNLNQTKALINEGDHRFNLLNFSCQAISDGGSQAYGFKFDRTSDQNVDGNKGFYRTTVYTPLNGNYQLEQLCSNQYNQFMTFYGNTTDSSTPSDRLVQLNFNPFGGEQPLEFNDWKSIFDLAENGVDGSYPLCVHMTNQEINVFWNAQYVYQRGLESLIQREIEPADRCFVPRFAR